MVQSLSPSMQQQIWVTRCGSLALGMCFKNLLQHLNTHLLHVIPVTLSPLSPLKILWPTCDLQLFKHARGETSTLMYHWLLAELLFDNPNYIAVYIDRSILHVSTSCAVIYKGQEFFYCLHSLAASSQQNSMPCSECCCIFINLDSVTPAQSPSVPSKVFRAKDTITRSLEILWQISEIPKVDKSVKFCWVPVHTGPPVMRLLIQLLGRLLLIESWSENMLSIVTFVFIFVAQFYLSGKMKGLQHRTTYCGQWSNTLRCDGPPFLHEKVGGPVHAPSDWAHSLDAQPFVMMQPSTSVCTVVYPLSSCIYFWKAQIMTDFHTFHLQGTLHNMLGDDWGKVSNVVAFLHCTGVEKFICFPFKSSLTHHRLIILNWPNYSSFHLTFPCYSNSYFS
jgi:hypothetical protein